MEPHHNHRSDLLLLFLIISFTASLITAEAVALPVAVSGGEKVKLNVFYEALCPACEDFILNHLYKIFKNGLISIVDLKLSPYGNANLRSDGKVDCQHGEWECNLNKVEACAIHAWPVVSDHFPFVYCVENLTYSGKYTEWETCFEKLNLNGEPVLDCYNSDLGHELMLQYDGEIKALQPPHTYVPWVTVDGQPLYENYTEFMSYICKAYKGPNAPQACLDESGHIKGPLKGLNHVCYKEEEGLKSKIISGSWMVESM